MQPSSKIDIFWNIICHLSLTMDYQPTLSHNILSLQDLFNVIYGKKIITDFKNGRLDSQGEPLEPSPEEGRHFIIVDKNLNSELGTQQYFSFATM